MTKAEKTLIWAWILFLFAWVVIPVLNIVLSLGALDPSGLLLVGATLVSIFVSLLFYTLIFVIWVLSILSTLWFCEEMELSKEMFIVWVVVSCIGCCCSIFVPTSLLVYKKVKT